MNILYKRSQTKSGFSLIPFRIAGGMVFTLRAKIDLSQEEQYLFDRYRFRDAVLIDGNPVAAVRKGIRYALLICIPVFAAVSVFWGLKMATAAVALLFVILTVFFYDKLREHIYVRDLLSGRSFQCFSVVELIEKETYLVEVCGYLRQVLESSQHWGGQQTIEVPALSPDAAKQAVSKGS